MEDAQVRMIKELLESSLVSDDEEEEDEEDDSGDDDDNSEPSATTLELNENDDNSILGDEVHHIHIYQDEEDNPYQVMEANTDDHVYQVLGNEIILITKGEGICCLCQKVSTILYTDNSYGNNIPVQLCSECIQKIMTTTTPPTEA